MASDATKIFTAMPKVTGALLWGPLGTPLPTDAVEELDDALKDLGYIGEDGFTESTQRDKTKKKAFGGATVKILQTEFGITLKFKFLESLSAEVLKAIHGEANVTITPATPTHGAQIAIKKNKNVVPDAVFVMEAEDGDQAMRSCIPVGALSQSGDVKVVHTDTIEYEVEIDCLEDEHGTPMYTYFDDGVLAP